MRSRHGPRSLIVALLVPLSCLLTSAWAAVSGVEHLITIGCDGLSPEGVQDAETPVLHDLMRQGAYTLHARSVMPTVSSPNWASIIMGAGPEQHGVTSNKWQRDKYEIAPTAIGPEGIFPTIFGILRAQRPKAVIGVFHDWEGFGRLVEAKSVDEIEHTPGPEATMAKAKDFWRQRKPTLLFLHLDSVDHAGHKNGWGTPEYLAAVAQADRLIGEFLKVVHESREADRSVVMLVSDHGGKDKEHGGTSMAEIEVPWIVAGRGIARGKEITSPVNVYDTAATAAYVLRLHPPACWIGKPVTEAFAARALSTPRQRFPTTY